MTIEQIKQIEDCVKNRICCLIDQIEGINKQMKNMLNFEQTTCIHQIFNELTDLVLEKSKYQASIRCYLDYLYMQSLNSEVSYQKSKFTLFMQELQTTIDFYEFEKIIFGIL